MVHSNILKMLLRVYSQRLCWNFALMIYSSSYGLQLVTLVFALQLEKEFQATTSLGVEKNRLVDVQSKSEKELMKLQSQMPELRQELDNCESTREAVILTGQEEIAVSQAEVNQSHYLLVVFSSNVL